MKKKTKTPAAKSAPVTEEHVLVLRTCDGDMRSYNRFLWPENGPVAAPHWDPAPECGNGLHGLLWGEGDGSLLNWKQDAKWMVVRVRAADVVQIINPPGKVKFPRGEVVFCGAQQGATEYLLTAPEGRGRAISGAAVIASRHGEAATAGYKGTATAGESGTATAGESGTATAGNWGTATAGESGTATAGNWGTATAGESGTATAGKQGVLVLRRWDGARYRLVVGYVGEEGIEAGKYYRLDDAGKIVPAPDKDAEMAAKSQEAKK